MVGAHVGREFLEPIISLDARDIAIQPFNELPAGIVGVHVPPPHLAIGSVENTLRWPTQPQAGPSYLCTGLSMALVDIMIDQMSTIPQRNREGGEVVPVWRIATSEDSYLIFTRFDHDQPEQRQRTLHLISRFMAWTRASCLRRRGGCVQKIIALEMRRF